MAWTENRVERLKKLWAEGLSASQIANRLGGCTRNAVISKVHRLGLSGRATTSRASRRKPRPRPQPNPKLQLKCQPQATAPEPAHDEEPVPDAEPEVDADVASAPPLEDIVMPRLGRLAIVALTEHMCRWPIGEPGDEDFRFCGRDSPPGVPYCDHHARIAYQPAQLRRARSAAK